VISDKSFCLEQEAGPKSSFLHLMDNQFIFNVATGIIVSVAIFAAYKAGQLAGLRELREGQGPTIDLEVLKQKMEWRLSKLLEETPGNVQLPGGVSPQDIFKKMVFPGESLEEQILSLNMIYLDLVEYGVNSKYFLLFANSLAAATL